MQKSYKVLSEETLCPLEGIEKEGWCFLAL